MMLVSSFVVWSVVARLMVTGVADEMRPLVSNQVDEQGSQAPIFNPNDVPCLRAKYHVLKQVSAGSFGVVYEAVTKVDTAAGKEGMKVAIKVMLNTDLNRHDQQVHQLLCTPNDDKSNSRIINLIETLTDEQLQLTFSIMEFASQGDVFHVCFQDQNHAFELSNDVIQTWLRQMFEAVEYCHSKNYVHFDLKLENFLVVSRSPWHLKLCDFAYACPEERIANIKVEDRKFGSPHTMAPEHFNGLFSFGKPADVWALGVMMFLLYNGNRLFEPKSMDNLKFELDAFAGPTPREGVLVPESAQVLMASMLKTDPSERLTITQCLQSVFFSDATDLKPTSVADNRVGTDSEPFSGSSQILN